MIRTKPYSLDPRELAKVAIRTNYVQLWWYVSIVVIAGSIIVLMSETLERDIIGGAIILAGFTAPMIRSLQTISDVKRSPLFKRVIHLEFGEEEFRQLDQNDELLTRVRYAELVAAGDLPEGIQLFVTKRNYMFVPRSAFVTKEDFDAVGEILRSARVRI